MNVYAILSLVACITSLGLAFFVYLKGYKKVVNRMFALFFLFVSMWLLGCFGVAFVENEHMALVCDKLYYTNVPLALFTVVIFISIILNIKFKRRIIIIGYLLAAIFIAFNLVPFLRSSFAQALVRDRHPYKFVSIPGPVWYLLLLYVISCAIYGLYMLFVGYRKSTGYSRNQLKYLLIGMVFLALTGLSCMLSAFRMFIPPGIEKPLMLMGNFILAYAIIKHRLMDINVAITKGTVFAVVYAFVLGIPVAVWFWGRTYLTNKIGANWGLVPIGIALILASLGPTIYGFIRRKAEAALFKERLRYQENLIALAKQMTLTKDLRGLLVLIIRNVTREIGISHARIYLLDRKTDEYVREVRYGKERRRQYGDSLYKGSPLVRILSRNRDTRPYLREEVISHFETNEPEHLGEIKGQLRSMGAAVLLPAFIGGELVAFLVLGTKRSKEIYTPDDLGMFEILAGQAGLAIENAQFYQELKEAQATVLQAAKLSSIGELAAGFAHQIDNPLGIISAGCQLCNMDIKEWLGRMNLPEEDKKVLETMEDRMNKVIDTAHRAADLVQRIRGYAKPADRDFEATDLNPVMEDALSLAQYQITHGGISVTKDIPQDLPKIKGIGVQLEQVFLNMIINACEAMAGKKGELAISARVGKEEPHKIEVVLADNGCGIPKENLKKLFDIFYTTKGSQGTGVGLSMAYRIVKDHNGDINIESEMGKGTKFTVSLPIWEEKKT